MNFIVNIFSTNSILLNRSFLLKIRKFGVTENAFHFGSAKVGYSQRVYIGTITVIGSIWEYGNGDILVTCALAWNCLRFHGKFIGTMIL